MKNWGGNMAFDFLDLGMGKAAKRREDPEKAAQHKVLQEEMGMIKAGLEQPIQEEGRTDQCIAKHGEGWWYDPELEMCSYKK